MAFKAGDKVSTPSGPGTVISARIGPENTTVYKVRPDDEADAPKFRAEFRTSQLKKATDRAGLHRALDVALDAKAKDKISEQIDPVYRRMLAQRLREAREMVKTAEPENRKYWADRIVEIEAILKGAQPF